MNIEDLKDKNVVCDGEEYEEFKICVKKNGVIFIFLGSGRFETDCFELSQVTFVDKKKFNEPWRPDMDEVYYYININGEVMNSNWHWKPWDSNLYEMGNCFKTQEEAEIRAQEIKVYNLLKNFSDANGGENIDWSNRGDEKYYLYYDVLENKFSINAMKYFKDIGLVYFFSEEIAEEALRRYCHDLEKLRSK